MAMAACTTGLCRLHGIKPPPDETTQALANEAFLHQVRRRGRCTEWYETVAVWTHRCSANLGWSRMCTERHTTRVNHILIPYPCIVSIMLTGYVAEVLSWMQVSNNKYQVHTWTDNMSQNPWWNWIDKSYRVTLSK